MKRYNVKRIKTKNHEEVYIKSVTDKVPNKRTTTNEKATNKRRFDQLGVLEQVQSIKSKKKYYKNKRYDIARLIDNNMDSRTKFITLTFRDSTDYDITDYEDSKKEFDKFIKRFRRYLMKTSPNYRLKYIAVHEIQKNRKAYHFHIIAFGIPYISNKILSELWGGGFVKINRIPNNVESQNIGIYISKYFAKEDSEVNFRNKYYSSRNLIKPEITYDLVPAHEVNKYTSDEIFGEIEQTKDYKYNRPAYGINKMTQLEEVHVTYIRKKTQI